MTSFLSKEDASDLKSLLSREREALKALLIAQRDADDAEKAVWNFLNRLQNPPKTAETK
jgi:hypothetical protein